MEKKPKETLQSPPDDPTSVDAAQTIDTPHFDEESIRNARPAVPLAQIRARRLWRLALVISASILAASVIGIALSWYKNRPEEISTSAAAVSSDVTSQNESSEPLTASTPGSEAKADDANSAPAEGKAGLGGTLHTRDTGANGGEHTRDAEDDDSRGTLNRALDEFIAATNARDIQRQMDFYDYRVNAFYLRRNVPRTAVRAEKSRVYDHANRIEVRAGTPGIHLSRDGRDATMLFRKKYAIEGGGEDRRGEVMQQLRWHRTAEGWKIVSERDLRVIH